MINKTISLNGDDWDYIKSLNINLSELIRDYLAAFVQQKKANISGINIQLTTLELEKDRAKATEILAKIKNNEQIIAKFNEIQAEIKEKQLKQEKEKLEKDTHCLNCGRILEGKTVEVKAGVVLCSVCGIDKDVLGKYFKK